MRSVISLLLVLSTVFFCFYSNRFLVSFVDDMNGLLSDMENEIRNNNFEEATEIYNHICSVWDKKEDNLSAFVSHELLGEIDLSLKKLEALTESKEKTAFICEKTEAEALLEHIKELNSLSYKVFI